MSAQFKASESGVLPWNPQVRLSRVNTDTVSLSRGFLRCKPERWFPGFGAKWLNLAHAASVEVKLLDARPILREFEFNFETIFSAEADGQALYVGLDRESATILGTAVCSDGMPLARTLTVEYLIRRLISSLAQAWSGPQFTAVKFVGPLHEAVPQVIGAIRISLDINSKHCDVWVLLSAGLISRLDELWRRQIHSSTPPPSEDWMVRIELGRLTISPETVPDYLRPGTIIDLEIAESDIAMLRVGERAWLTVKLFNNDGQLAFEVLPTMLASSVSLPSATQLAVELGAIKIKGEAISELAQIGAMWRTDLKLGTKVNLTVGGEVLGQGELGTFDGRFAVTVG